MKLLQISRFALAAFILASLTLTSCKKEISNSGTGSDQEEIETTVNSAEADAEAETIYNSVFDDVMGVDDEVGMAGTGVFGRTTTSGNLEEGRTPDSLRCFTVTRTPLNPPNRFPLLVTINFGNGCTGPDGNIRKGKIKILYTGRLVVPGNSATTTFDNYYVNNIKVEGTHTVKNESTPNDLKYTVKVEDGKLSKPNGDFSKWNSVKAITQTAGLGTPFWPVDDVFAMTGAARGEVMIGQRNFFWKSEITEPLVKRFTCRWLVSGKVKTVKINTSLTNPWVAVLNFGFPSNDCDNKAALTINGVTTIITL